MKRHAYHSLILDQDVHYSLFYSKNLNNPHRVAYIFHGGNGDDTQGQQLGLPQIIAELDQDLMQNTVFAFPYIGKSFLRAHPTLPQKNFAPYFWREIFLTVNKKLSILPENRFLAGWSMGGQAALNMAFRYPQLFGGVGVHFLP